MGVLYVVVFLNAFFTFHGISCNRLKKKGKRGFRWDKKGGFTLPKWAAGALATQQRVQPPIRSSKAMMVRLVRRSTTGRCLLHQPSNETKAAREKGLGLMARRAPKPTRSGRTPTFRNSSRCSRSLQRPTATRSLPLPDSHSESAQPATRPLRKHSRWQIVSRCSILAQSRLLGFYSKSTPQKIVQSNYHVSQILL